MASSGSVRARAACVRACGRGLVGLVETMIKSIGPRNCWGVRAVVISPVVANWTGAWAEINTRTGPLNSSAHAKKLRKNEQQNG